MLDAWVYRLFSLQYSVNKTLWMLQSIPQKWKKSLDSVSSPSHTDDKFRGHRLYGEGQEMCLTPL